VTLARRLFLRRSPETQLHLCLAGRQGNKTGYAETLATKAVADAET
jgi:hypothetical protein